MTNSTADYDNVASRHATRDISDSCANRTSQGSQIHVDHLLANRSSDFRLLGISGFVLAEEPLKHLPL
jgi:hypothetical protein